jgi:hypothetical protein
MVEPRTALAALDAESFDLHLRLFTPEHDVEGRARVTVRNTGPGALSELRFFLHPELRLRSVTDSTGRDLTFAIELIAAPFSITLSAFQVTVSRQLEPGAAATLEFAYDGWLNPSGIRAARDESYSDSFLGVRADVAFLRSVGYTFWFPSPHADYAGLNDLADYRLELDIPDRFRPIAFGVLLSEQTADGRNVSVWQTRRPINLLAPCIFLDKWVVTETGTLRLCYHGDPQSKEAARAYAKVAEPLLAFFRGHYSAGLAIPDAPMAFAELNIPMGAYAAPGVVGLSRDGFLEILTADQETQYGLFSWLGHEMVHEYVLTPTDLAAKGQAIIQDGFALYCHLPGLWRVLGEEFEQWDLRRRWRSYEEGLDTGRLSGTPVPPHVPLAEITLEQYYAGYKDFWLTDDKLQIILHRLQRHVVGDKAFLRGFARYLEQHRQTPATLDAFRTALEEASGLDLRDFFHRWFCTTERLPDAWTA